MSEVDPFACFNDNNEDEEALTSDAASSLPRIRSPECSVLAFHRGTEKSLLTHVRSKASRGSPESILKAIDDFSSRRHWMMHVGPEKALILKSFLTQCVQNRNTENQNEPFVLVELGTYCGYSSILWADTLQRLGIDFHVYTLEATFEFVHVATEMIALSGLASSISVLHLDLERNQHLIELLRRNKLSRLDFLFLDHDKDAYLQDLKELEQASFVGKGVYVAADNVLFAGIDNYRQYIQLLVHKGIVRSNLVRTNLEYSEQEREIEPSSSVYEDGIELTLYLEHPIDVYTSNY